MADAVAEIPPAPAADPLANSDLMRNYDPVGALNGLFAPGYAGGSTVSRDAVAKWNAENRGMTNALVDQLRMPNPATPGGGETFNVPYGQPQPKNASFLDPKGSLDPEALRVLAQGGKYDYGGRRNAIAAQVMANQQAPAPAPAAPAPYDPYEAIRRQEELQRAWGAGAGW